MCSSLFQVSVNFVLPQDKSSVEPSTKIQVSGKADASSIVALVAVDKSVFLLGSSNLLTRDGVRMSSH